MEGFEYIESAAENETIEAFAQENGAGNIVIGIIDENRECYFSSIYNDNELAELWCGQYKIEEKESVAVVFGIANGTYVRKLRKNHPYTDIIVYEPSYSVMKLNIDNIGIADLTGDEKLWLLAGEESLGRLALVLDEVITYQKSRHTYFCISPNYEGLFDAQLEKVGSLVKYSVERQGVNKKFYMEMGEKLCKNIMCNALDYITQYSAVDLINAFHSQDLSGVPAIIVAAGPSLDKNITELQKAKDKAFIITVDTALEAMARVGIMPDITLSVDPEKELFLFERKETAEVPMVCMLSTNSDIRKYHRGMRIYGLESDSVINKYIIKFGKNGIGLGTGGSVSHVACSLAEELGFKTIIFVGQDLAYSEDKEYSAKVKGGKRTKLADTDSSGYIWVEDIYGGRVRTNENMDAYRRWFEREILQHPEIRYIDATEGGARKAGMEILTLGEAIERECTAEAVIDFGSIISGLGTSFNSAEKKYILEDLSNFEQHMEDIRKWLDRTARDYERLDEMNRKHKYTGKEFERLLQSVRSADDRIKNDRTITFLNQYVTEEQYRGGEVWQNTADKYEEIKTAVRNGTDRLKAIHKATYMAEKDFQYAVENSGKAGLQN